MIPNHKLQELVEARKKAHADAVRFLRANMTPADRQGYERAMADVDRLQAEIEKGRRGYALSSDNGTPNKHVRDIAFGKYLRFGDGILNAEERQAITPGVEFRDEAEGVPLTNHIGTYTGLGYLVPTGFVYDIEQATKWFAPVLDIFGRIDTASGQPLPYPTSNDTTQQAQMVGEANPVNEEDVAAVSHVLFGAWKMSSGVVKCSIELMQDSAFNIENWLAERFGERWGRFLENITTNGNGAPSAEPQGILGAIAASGATPVVAAGSSANDGSGATGANSIGYGDLVNLEHSVDPSYRNRAKYMFHDLTLAAIKKLLDKYGRPLWAPGITAGDPDRINGYEYVINQSMPQIAASNTTVVFGDLSKFKVRVVKPMTVQRLVEAYAVNGQIGFITFQRADSNLVDAGTHPINVLQQHS